jgi:ribosomal protein L35
MPKMKTNSAASKRVRVTGSGKLMHAGSAMRHNLEHKSARKRTEGRRRSGYFPEQEHEEAARSLSIARANKKT